MKRIITAVALAALSVPAMAGRAAESSETLFDPQTSRSVRAEPLKYGLPFEQTQFDRGFPADIADGASSPSSGTSAGATTYEQLRIDRGVPAYTVPHEHGFKDPVWASDPYFIAPPM